MRLIALALALMLAVACSKTTQAPQAIPSVGVSPSGSAFGFDAAVVDVTKEPGTIFNVTYKPSTVVIDAPTVQHAFLGASADGKTWRFDGSVGAIAALKPGSIVLFSDLALLRVANVRSESGQTVVDAAPAELTDAIQDGEIRIRHDIRFATLVGGQSVNRGHDLAAGQGLLNAIALPALADVTLSGEGVSYSTKIRDFDITAKAKVTPGKVSFLVQAKRSWSDISVVALMKGEVSDFREDLDINIKGGAFQSVSINQTGLGGSADFEVSGHKDSPGPGTLSADAGFLGIPSIIKIPLDVGGLPVTIGIGTAMLIRPAFTGNGEFVALHYKFDFNGMNATWTKDSGFADLVTGKTSPELIASQALSAIGPFGFIGAVAAPRIDLGFGIGKINFGPSVTLQLILSGSMVSNGAATSMLPCRVTRAFMWFKVSSKASLLGVTVSGPAKTVQLGKRTWIDPAIEGCYKFAKDTESSSQ